MKSCSVADEVGVGVGVGVGVSVASGVDVDIGLSVSVVEAASTAACGDCVGDAEGMAAGALTTLYLLKKSDPPAIRARIIIIGNRNLPFLVGVLVSGS